MALNNINSSKVFFTINIDTTVEKSDNVINIIVYTYVSVYGVSTFIFPLWFDENLRQLVKSKCLFHKNCKINLCLSAYLSFYELQVRWWHVNYFHDIQNIIILLQIQGTSRTMSKNEEYDTIYYYFNLLYFDYSQAIYQMHLPIICLRLMFILK